MGRGVEIHPAQNEYHLNQEQGSSEPGKALHPKEAYNMLQAEIPKTSKHAYPAISWSGLFGGFM